MFGALLQIAQNVWATLGTLLGVQSNHGRW